MVVGLASPVHTSQQTWGLIATVGYACASLAAARSPVRWPHLAGFIAVIGTVAVPLVWLTVAGLEQMEVGVVERGADLLTSSGTPYLHHPVEVPDFNPYLPGMTLFGLPRVLFGDSMLTSARLWCLVGYLATAIGAMRVTMQGVCRYERGSTTATGVLWLTACPLVALPLAFGGVDPPVVGLLLLALACAHRGRPGLSGVALGVAASLKWTAWPAIPVVASLLMASGGRRPAAKCVVVSTGVGALAVLPPLLVDPAGFYQNVVLYPFGLSATTSSAESPLLGHLLVATLPHGKSVAVALIAVSAVAVAASLLIRPPRTAAAAAHRLGWGLSLAIALSPATRVGYAIYPVVLFVWPSLCRLTRSTRGKDSTDTAQWREGPPARSHPGRAVAP
ncbi:glycosyltransferase family 87 protein [Streptomyces sp. WM6378]|uniref:glycosyltransferase family 87 protein n=1 Tax=Streptomyces sp. WM6378 TaxID=1415557 RepID=UPI001F40F198|nr:glycosyltransferase 87 family protein [Streptomyces sp. WM6378]